MLKVLTLNIAHGAPTLPVPFPFLLPRRRPLSHLDRVAELLARATRTCSTAPPSPPGVCSRGTALLSHWPLLEPESHRFEGLAPIDKGYVVAAVDSGGGRLLDVVSTHLDFSSERRRQQQAVHLIEALQRRPHRPRLVMGDMNSRQGNPGAGCAGRSTSTCSPACGVEAGDGFWRT